MNDKPPGPESSQPSHPHQPINLAEAFERYDGFHSAVQKTIEQVSLRAPSRPSRFNLIETLFVFFAAKAPTRVPRLPSGLGLT